MEYRQLSKEEISFLKEIDRSEIIEKIYYFRDGQLVLEDEFHDVKYDWWVKKVNEKMIPSWKKGYDNGVRFFGAFDGSKIVGIGGLGSEFFGKNNDQLNVWGLFVHIDYRKRGIATQLMELIKNKARERGARKLYISSVPSENTVNFYLGIGCKVTDDVDKELFELEPEDIHMELEL